MRFSPVRDGFAPVGEGITYLRLECANCLAHTRIKRAEYRAMVDRRAPFLCEICGARGVIEGADDAVHEHRLLVGA